MYNRHFFFVALLGFLVVFLTSFFAWKIFWPEAQVSLFQRIDELTSPQTDQAAQYENIELDMPVEAFLNRCTSSSNLSMVRKAYVTQWVYYNQPEIIKLLMYGQASVTFNELKKALEVGMHKEPKNGAIAMVQGALNIVSADLELIAYANRSLATGLTPELHELRGDMMQAQDKKEQKKLKHQYKKALAEWIDAEHGAMIDKIIAQV